MIALCRSVVVGQSLLVNKMEACMVWSRDGQARSNLVWRLLTEFALQHDQSIYVMPSQYHKNTVGMWENYDHAFDHVTVGHERDFVPRNPTISFASARIGAAMASARAAPSSRISSM